MFCGLQNYWRTATPAPQRATYIRFLLGKRGVLYAPGTIVAPLFFNHACEALPCLDQLS